MKQPLPRAVADFQLKYPKVWDNFRALAEACHDEGGPLDEKSRRLIKLAISIGHRHEGAVHSATRLALAAGISPEELFHAAILAITTLGWPASYAAMTWIADVVEQKPTGTPHSEP